jgi:hypothetical protein
MAAFEFGQSFSLLLHQMQQAGCYQACAFSIVYLSVYISTQDSLSCNLQNTEFRNSPSKGHPPATESIRGSWGINV